MDQFSIEHGFNFVIEGLVIQIVDFDGLEVFLWIKVSLGNQKSLSQHYLFYFSIVVIHDIVINIAFLLAHLQEISNLFSR